MNEIRDGKVALTKIKLYFEFLFKDGFQLVKTYDRLPFGNWVVVLNSEKCICRFIQDREQVSITVAPAWASLETDNSDHFISLVLLAKYMDGNETVVLESRKSLDINSQFENLRRVFVSHYDQIVSLLTDKEFLVKEKEIKLFQQRQLKRAFPNARF